MRVTPRYSACGAGGYGCGGCDSHPRLYRAPVPRCRGVVRCATRAPPLRPHYPRPPSPGPPQPSCSTRYSPIPPLAPRRRGGGTRCPLARNCAVFPTLAATSLRALRSLGCQTHTPAHVLPATTRSIARTHHSTHHGPAHRTRPPIPVASLFARVAADDSHQPSAHHRRQRAAVAVRPPTSRSARRPADQIGGPTPRRRPSRRKRGKPCNRMETGPSASAGIGTGPRNSKYVPPSLPPGHLARPRVALSRAWPRRWCARASYLRVSRVGSRDSMRPG